jgi:hypothetical protein
MYPNRWEIERHNDGSATVRFYFDTTHQATVSLTLEEMTPVAEALRALFLTTDEPDEPMTCWECGGPIAGDDLVIDVMGPAHRSCVGG